MDIERVIKKIRDIREAAPTNSSGANGFTNAAGTGPVAGYDKRLFGVTDDLLSQDYQTPDESGLAIYRFSNVYPVEKLSEKDIDNMVSASKEYDELVDEQRFGRRDYMKEKLQKVIDAFRSLKEDKIINDGKKLVNPKKNPLIKKEEMAVGGVPTNNASSGNIAGLPPDSPPVKQKKRYIYSGRGSRRMWLANKKNG
tara:strand:- start:31 stop:621 length:591 start_codon:yes stop_codon:yes gene_type:complete